MGYWIELVARVLLLPDELRAHIYRLRRDDDRSRCVLHWARSTLPGLETAVPRRGGAPHMLHVRYEDVRVTCTERAWYRGYRWTRASSREPLCRVSAPPMMTAYIWRQTVEVDSPGQLSDRAVVAAIVLCVHRMGLDPRDMVIRSSDGLGRWPMLKWVCMFRGC